MHLIALMEKAGVNLSCTEEKEEVISTVIDHHTLKRLGYRLHHGGWDYVGRGHVNASFPVERQGEHGGEEHDEGDEEGGTQEATQEHTRVESTTPSRPPPRSGPSYLQLQSQIKNLVTKLDLTHFQNYVTKQFQLLQATLLSKLDSMDSRVQNYEAYLRFHHQPPPSPIIPPTSNPKGKAPMSSPSPTFHSPISSPHSTSCHTPTPTPALSPQHIPIESDSSFRSSSQSASHYALIPYTAPAHAPFTHSNSSTDSEATQSNPPSKTPSPTHPATTPITPPPIPPPSFPPPPPQPTSPLITAAYQRYCRSPIAKLYPSFVPCILPPP